MQIGAGNGLTYESRALALATAMLESQPRVALECVRVVERAGGSDALRAERLHLGFEAARRASVSSEARRFATELIERAPSSEYAVRARRWLEANGG